MIIEKVILEGPGLRLESLAIYHKPGLAAAITDGELWTIDVTLVPHPRDLDSFITSAEAAFAAQTELAFAIIDKASNSVAGSSRFRNINHVHKRLEIGFTFFGQSWQRTHVNTEAKYLMLKHAFENLHCNRVEFLTDVLNSKSRTAIMRIGAREEGVLRSHMVMRGGRIRDSMIYSIVRADWPAVSTMLQEKMQAQRTIRQ